MIAVWTRMDGAIRGRHATSISELNPGLWHPLPTLREERRRPRAKARFRLAGCAFAGRVLNPLDRYERFQLTFILLSRTSHDAMGPAPERRSRGALPHLLPS